MLLSVRAAFAEFGQYAGLRLNLTKTKVLLQGVGPWAARLAGMQVVCSVRYLGVLFGDVTPADAFDSALATVEARCTLLSRMPLS